MNQPDTRQPAKKGSGGTILKFFAFGCLAMILLSGAAAYYVYVKAGDWGRELGATAITSGPTMVMQEMGLPQTEIDAALVPLQGFAKDIRDEKVTMQRGMKVVEALFEGAAFTSLMMRGFELKYLEGSDLTDEQKKAAHINLTRFNHGIGTKQIDRKKAEELSNIVMITTHDAQGRQQKKLKDSITPEERQQCLTLMKDAADEAGIEEKEFPIDLANDFDQAIKKGMAAADKLESKEPLEDAGHPGE